MTIFTGVGIMCWMEDLAKAEPTDAEPTDTEGTAHGPSATPVERALAGIAGCATTAAGTVAVFRTENEVGTGALLLGGAAFLAMAIFGLVPVRFKVGDKEVEVARAALRTLTKVASTADPATQEAIVDTFEQELAVRGVRRDQADAVESMLNRFERYSGSPNARLVYDALLAAGWQPSTPAKSTYIRWVYSGRLRTISFFQNSGSLAVASAQVRDYAKTLPGATTGPKDEALFAYAGDPNIAIDAADAIRRYADT